MGLGADRPTSRPRTTPRANRVQIEPNGVRSDSPHGEPRLLAPSADRLDVDAESLGKLASSKVARVLRLAGGAADGLHDRSSQFGPEHGRHSVEDTRDALSRRWRSLRICAWLISPPGQHRSNDGTDHLWWNQDATALRDGHRPALPGLRPRFRGWRGDGVGVGDGGVHVGNYDWRGAPINISHPIPGRLELGHGSTLVRQQIVIATVVGERVLVVRRDRERLRQGFLSFTLHRRHGWDIPKRAGAGSRLGRLGRLGVLG